MKINKTLFGILALLLISMPFAVAQNANETFEVKGGKEYPVLERALDRIKLAFTLQTERKLELINKLQQRREEHYQFLVAKGKTEQAERFKATTIGLVKNFEQWKATKQEIIGRMEKKAAEVKNETAMKEKAEEAMEKKGEAMEKKPSPKNQSQ